LPPRSTLFPYTTLFRSRRSGRSRPRRARRTACRRRCPGQSSHDGRVVAAQAWDPLEASQCERGESATKAQQYTRPRMLHWEIMGLRAAIALLMLLGLGLVDVVG